MFGDFSFNRRPNRSRARTNLTISLDPFSSHTCVLNDADVSPFTVKTPVNAAGQGEPSLDYFSLERRRKQSLSSTLQTLTLSSRNKQHQPPSNIPTPPDSGSLLQPPSLSSNGLWTPDVSPPPTAASCPPPPFASPHLCLVESPPAFETSFQSTFCEQEHTPVTRLQRQILTQLQSAPSQMRALSSLVEDMIAAGEFCNTSDTRVLPSPPSSEYGDERAIISRIRKEVVMKRRAKSRTGSSSSDKVATVDRPRISKRACSTSNLSTCKQRFYRRPVKRRSYYAPRDGDGISLAVPVAADYDSGVEDLDML